MSDTRTPFELTVALTAASRDIDLDTAHAALIGEAVEWITAHASSAGLEDAILLAARSLSQISTEYSDEAERWQNAALATDNDTTEYDTAHAANRAMSKTFSTVAHTLYTVVGPF